MSIIKKAPSEDLLTQNKHLNAIDMEKNDVITKNRIVTTGIRIDLHIHSFGSHFKDHSKVKDLTIDNIKILINELNNNKINMCAITDHDNFEIDIYNRLKLEENKGSIQKVLPAVEFSVEINNKVIHIVVVFDDNEPEKLTKIKGIIFGDGSSPAYDSVNKEAFKEDKFLKILKTIDLDTVMIAHQKNSITSKRARKNDVSTLGNDKMAELVFLNYFQAFEFKSANTEFFHKYYLANNKENLTMKDMRFITGSDCHDWNNYSEEIKNTEPAYLKCLSTFRGLSMAVTDYSRINHVNSFFSVSDKGLNKIQIEINGKKHEIELSKGINAIIGDNSIGKSLLINKMTDYIDVKKSLRDNYEKYLKENKISINTKIELSNIYVLDKQGSIREKFENKSKLSEMFNGNFPIAPNIVDEKEIVKVEVNNFLALLENKKEYSDTTKKIKNFKLFVQEKKSTRIQLKNININFDDIEKELSSILESYSMIMTNIKIIQDSSATEEKDKSMILHIQVKTKELQDKYIKKQSYINYEKCKINIVNMIITQHDNILNKTRTDSDKANRQFQISKDQLISNTVDLVNISKKITNFNVNIKNIPLKINSNPVGDYNFISKCSIESISNEYIVEQLKKPFKVIKQSINLNNIQYVDLPNIIKGNEDNINYLEFYREKIFESIEEDFKVKNAIVEKGQDLTREMSAGFNSKIYFDILAYQNERDGIYIIDQPEDDVSAVKIKDYLLDNFREMGSQRQILLITHNPQFIVNLDVDNLIFINKENGEINIEYGALEYKDEKCDILKIVSDNVEGGIKTINERWKKYEKKI